MSWELIAAIAVAAWILGLGLLVTLMRAASRGDAMLDAEARRVNRARTAEVETEPEAEPAPAARERWTPDPAPAPRERWTLGPEAEQPADRKSGDRDRVERRRLPR